MTLRAISWRAVSTKEQAEDDKASLDAQERQHRAFISENGWQLVADLVVPGHSRNYIDFFEMADDAARAGISAFRDLERHWKARDFDVLLVRDGDRFAREQAPLAMIISRIIAAGARIYSFQDGWVDEHNYRMVIAMWGYRASTEVDQMKKRFRSGKEGRVRQGINAHARLPIGYVKIRDGNGRLKATVFDEANFRRVVDAAATLLLEHVSWKFIEAEMFSRFGIVNPTTGKPYTQFAFYRWFHTPWIWGHGVRYWKSPDVPNGQKTGLWAFDESITPPVGVLIAYNVVPPVFTGERANAIKAELRRRRMFQGGARPNRSHRFTGLLICGYCGYHMVFSGKKNDPAYRCHSVSTARLRPGCDQYRYIRESAVQEWVDTKLREMLVLRAPYMLASNSNLPEDGNRAIEQIARELASIQQQITSLIRKQATAPQEISDLYDEELGVLAARRQINQRNLEDAERKAYIEDTTPAVEAFNEIREIGIDDFWELDDTRINGLLHRVFMNRRMVVFGKRIEHVGEAPPVPQHVHGKRKKRKNQ